MKLINKVELEFFKDDANGEYGITHKNAFDTNNPFNAFWNGRGIFHDVFEHYFENNHKYFMDDYSFNVGGEMAAMGAAMYYYNVLEVYNRPFNNNHSFTDSILRTTFDMIDESISEGYYSFGYTLESNVPRQKPVHNYELECMLDEFWNKTKDCQVNTEYVEEKEDGLNYKKSVLKSKINNLHRYGFKMAEKMINDNAENSNTLVEFINFWDKFCKQNDSEEMTNHFNGITFEIYKDSDNVISWKAILIPTYYDMNEYIITSDDIQRIPYLEDIILECYPLEEIED